MNRTLPLILTAALLLTACTSAVPAQPADATTSPSAAASSPAQSDAAASSPVQSDAAASSPVQPDAAASSPVQPDAETSAAPLTPNSPSAIFSPSLRAKPAAPSGTPATRSMSSGTPAI